MYATPTQPPPAAAAFSFALPPPQQEHQMIMDTAAATTKSAAAATKKKPAAPRRNFDALEAKVELLECTKRKWERRARNFQLKFVGALQNQNQVLSAMVAQQTGQSAGEALYHNLGVQLQARQAEFETMLGAQLKAQITHILTSAEIRQKTVAAAASTGEQMNEAQIESNVSMNVQRRDQILVDAWRSDLVPFIPTVPKMKDTFFKMEELFLAWRIDLDNTELSLPGMQTLGGERIQALQSLVGQHRRSIVVLAAGVTLLQNYA